jgi:hypothetical protein
VGISTAFDGAVPRNDAKDAKVKAASIFDFVLRFIGFSLSV